MALASIIIPVWNGIHDLPACLEALAALNYPEREIIAVDNASTDGSGDWIAAHYPAVHLIRNAENSGFGGACNLGLAAAKGETLVLLNQDTIVRPDWLTALVKVLEQNGDIGIAGSKALYPDGTIQHAGGTIDKRGASTHLGYHQEDRGEFDRLMDVDYITGASLALRRALYQQIGGFDPAFFPAYLEDVDLCWRARAAGWRVVYTPDSVLIHNERSSGVRPSYEGAQLYHKQRMRFVCKHWSTEQLRDEFLPAEIAWMKQLEPTQEEWLAAAHHAYLVQLLNLGELSTWRQALLGETPAAIEQVAQVLLTLRRFYPLNSMGISDNRTFPPLGQLQEARLVAEIKETPFRSGVPVVGRFIAAFRQSWNRVATEWYVKPMIRQQSQFNALLLNAVNSNREQQHYIQLRTAEAFAEYLQGHSSELSELAQEVETLKRRVSDLSQRSQQPESQVESQEQEPQG